MKETEAAKADAYHPFEPQRTQEVMAGLNGCADTWGLVLAMFDGDWSYLEVEDERD